MIPIKDNYKINLVLRKRVTESFKDDFAWRHWLGNNLNNT